MTNEELGTIEAQGKDPLNSFEDARDGLETLGAGVVRLVTEVRRLRAQSSGWADIADEMAKVLGDPTTTEHVALATRVRRERDEARDEARLWKALATALEAERRQCTLLEDDDISTVDLARAALRAAGIDPDAP